MARLEARNVSKSYPGVLALDDMTIQFEPGEVHGVIGENGAGKSTLMKLLSGVEHPTSGSVLVEGQAVNWSGVREALAAGVAMIHQELNLVGTLTVAENIALGREPGRLGVLDRRAARETAKKWLAEVQSRVDPDVLVEDLSIAGQQLVEIAKALSHEAKVLIMDEPTAVLSERETTALLQLMRRLRDQGTTVIFISHILEQLVEVCDRITVLRDGQFVATLPKDEADEARLAKLMVGRELADYYPDKASSATDEVLLSVTGLAVPGHASDVSFQVHRGEVLGIAGLVGSGRTETAEAIVGLRPCSGEVQFRGKAGRFMNNRRALDEGVAYVSEDRKLLGLHLSRSVGENVTMANLSAYGRVVIDRGKERTSVLGWIKELQMKVAGADVEVRTLSGGNQQKVSLAKWLDCEPALLLLDEPTRGVDVGTKSEIYHLVRRLAATGMTFIVISSEMPELIGLCDRTLVMREGKSVGELEGDDMTEEKMMMLVAGVGA